MPDDGLVIAPAGWFADPTGLSELRWWSGEGWTEHVATRPAMHPADIPRPGTVLTVAPTTVPVSLPPTHPTASAYVPFSQGARSGSWSADPRVWTATGQPRPTRWNTAGAWALSATPWIAVFSGIGLAFAWSVAPRTWWWSLAVVLLPLLWTIAAASRDRGRLDELGYRRVPSRWWLLLGPLAYLIARTVHVRRQSGHGSAPLWWYAANVVLPVAMALAGLLVIRALFGGGAGSGLPGGWGPAGH
jgi:hypothetical protein